MTSDDYPYWTYDDLREYDYDSYLEYLEDKYHITDSVDSDSVEYPPVEYWESGI